jgi:hypothetical protein
VFCCFNQTHKIAAPTFDVWMRLHLETAYATMWELWQRGESPRPFAVAPHAPQPDRLTDAAER